MEETTLVIDVKAIPLHGILNRNANDCATFCSELQKDGFTIIDISDSKEFVNARNTLRQLVTEFFEKDENEKSKSLCENDFDMGYIDIPNVKEIFQVRLSNENWIQWPSIQFQNACYQYYQLMQSLSKHCLQIIANYSDIPEELFLNLLDPPFDSTSSHMTTSLLRIIRYHTSWENNKNVHMYHHSDIGLLTFVPISSIAGVELLRLTDNKWINIESSSDPEKHMLVISAELLQAITRKKYRALMHRVICRKQNRISMPFFTIPRPNVPIHLMNEEK